MPSMWTGFNMVRKGRREPVETGYIFQFYIPDLRLRYKRLILFVPNFNAISDEDGVIDQSYHGQ